MALTFNKFFWSVAVASWAIFALTIWLRKKSMAMRPVQGINAQDVDKLFDSAKALNSPREPAKYSKRAKLLGWLAGIGFIYVAAPIVALTVMVLFPDAAKWRMPKNPLVGLTILFLFPVGPAILLGRAVARRISFKDSK